MATRSKRNTSNRILAAAEDLVVKRGFKSLTITEIAEKAHVGKGTVYLYWSTKEDLLLGLLARNFLAVLDECIAATAEDPNVARPHRLCPRLVHSSVRRPLGRALQSGDTDVLGALADHPRSKELMTERGIPAVLGALLPVWRRHGLARTDWRPEEQACALYILILGFLEATARQRLISGLDSPEETMAAMVKAVLGEEDVGPAAIRAAGDEALEILRASREALFASITDSEE